MKKKILSFLLLTAMMLGLFSTTAWADTQTYVPTMDLTIETPKAGMTQKEGEKLALLSAKTAYGDLLAKGAVQLLKVRWSGEFDQTDRSNPKFKAGMTYTATIQIHFVYEKGYVANHKIVNDNYHMDSSLFKVTVNGVAAETQEGSPGNPTVKVNLTVAAPELSDEEKEAAERARLEKFDLRHASLRASATAYTSAEADSLWVEQQAYDTIVLNMTTGPKNGYMGSKVIDNKLNKDYITGVLIDFDFDLFANEYQAENFTKHLVFEYDNLKEIWLSDKVDAVKFLKTLKSATEGNGIKLEKWYWTNSTSFGTADATLYIPSSAVAEVYAAYNDDILSDILGYISIYPCFSIKVYDGDVYTAEKAGGSAARDFCTEHVYNSVIMAADRIANLADCSQEPLWYYSCSICGKCEYNDQHTINRDYMYNKPVPKAEHDYSLDLATEEAYIGVNAAGDQVFWKSCIYCGHSYNYHREHLTEEDYKNAGSTELTFEYWKERMVAALKQRESEALNYTTTQVDMFTLSAKSDAKMSVEFQSDVNFALDNGLLDTALLGSDYTKSINRLQLCSIAVRLAEELTGKEISYTSFDNFKDTKNLYTRKAYAAGFFSDISSAIILVPSKTVTRQEMATVFYRVLQYVKENSSYRYTDYTSNLSAYTDSGELKSWAVEAMAFMNALGLLEGTSDTTLSPNAICTIEQAVAVAYRSIYAHQIGWYQATESVRYQSGTGGVTTYITLDKGERIWVTGNRIGYSDTLLDQNKGAYKGSYCYFPVVEPHTGETCYISATKLKPIRD
ncbi:MAG: S-layer homology domain-containing protein [Lachnospiraceae bacterium]